MPVPSSITDLSVVASSNYPSGSDSPSTIDDVQRAHASFIAQIRDGAVPIVGTGLTGTAAALTVGNAAKSVNISGGTVGQIHYQSAPDTTALLPVGTAGQVLVSAGANPPAWQTLVTTPPGTVIDFAGATAPAGYLACPTVATDISRTTYAALFAAIGTVWGVGDGSTTFGMPWFAADYAAVQASGNVGTQTVGAVIAHTHAVAGGASNATSTNGGVAPAAQTTATTTASTGGSANLPAGVRMLKCVKV